MSHPALNNVDEVEHLLKVCRDESDVQFLIKCAPHSVVVKAILNIINKLKDTTDQLEILSR